MKSTIKALGILVLAVVIGFSFITCGDGDDGGGGGNSGKLTITGLGDYNGKYACAWGSDSTETEELIAAKSINFSRGEIVCERINGGSVVLNVWVLNRSGTNGAKYNGSDNIMFEVDIFDKEKPDFDEDEPIAEGVLTVAFANGTANGVFVDMSSW
jgi:ABC-type cobalt transport system substrate-binding protein